MRHSQLSSSGSSKVGARVIDDVSLNVSIGIPIPSLSLSSSLSPNLISYFASLMSHRDRLCLWALDTAFA